MSDDDLSKVEMFDRLLNDVLFDLHSAKRLAVSDPLQSSVHLSQALAGISRSTWALGCWHAAKTISEARKAKDQVTE